MVISHVPEIVYTEKLEFTVLDLMLKCNIVDLKTALCSPNGLHGPSALNLAVEV